MGMERTMAGSLDFSGNGSNVGPTMSDYLVFILISLGLCNEKTTVYVA